MSRGSAGRRSRPAFAAAAVLGAFVVLGAVVAVAGATEGTAQCTGRVQGEGEESTLVILKPDGVARGLVGEAISRFEKAHLELVEVRSMQAAPREVLREHYKEHAARKFYQELIDSMASGTIVILHLRGSKAVARVRKMLGSTDPSVAEPGSLRGMYGIDKTKNFMHASDSAESAAREIKLWLPPIASEQ